MIAMSGGVDSSVAALLMKRAGYEPIGVTMRLLSNEDLPPEEGRTCCSLSDVEDARQAAFSLGMRYYVFNFTEAFHREVMDGFVRAYSLGLTPNPCVECNRRIKFGELLRRCEEAGCEKLATGHYARLAYDEGSSRWLLKKGRDRGKDQSYMLSCLNQRQLSRCAFPLGEYTKEETRELARESGFACAEKRDSQDICFVPDGDYAGFLMRYAGAAFTPGDFVTSDGRTVGRHRGIERYTIGQRKGIGLSFPEPMYVTRLDPAGNRVFLGRENELYSKTVRAVRVNFVAAAGLSRPEKFLAKIRYRQREQPALASQIGEDELLIEFDEPQRAVTPGQTVVLYDGDTVVAGGEIAP